MCVNEDTCGRVSFRLLLFNLWSVVMSATQPAVTSCPQLYDQVLDTMGTCLVK